MEIADGKDYRHRGFDAEAYVGQSQVSIRKKNRGRLRA
jgi:hypothetical protein